MKNILGHKSWNKKEILQLLRSSNAFTMCNLPHYRYDRVKQICYRLEHAGWIEAIGKKKREAIHWQVTEKWKAYHDASDLV